MHRRFFALLAFSAMVALFVVSTASAGSPITSGTVLSGTTLNLNVLTVTPDQSTHSKSGPTGDMLQGGGGGNGLSGCGTATDSQSDWAGSTAKADLHWCYNGKGTVTSYYTWSEQYPCGLGCSSMGFNYDYQFPYGRNTQAQFNVIDLWLTHYTTQDHACVAGNGYGGAWACA